MKTIVQRNEKALLLRLRQGDHRAFNSLYDRYKSQLTRNLISLLKDDVLAEDTLQELFFRLWDRRETIDPEQPIAGYLFRISANLVHDHFRKLVRDQKTVRAFWETVLLHQEDPDTVRQQEMDETLYKVLDQLSPQRKRVFLLCKFEQKTYQQVADLLHISVSAVRDHIIKANKYLKSQYDRPESSALLVIFVVEQLTKGLF
ncbi:MAG: sigma-70 family RNA polymerase sigma factor [Parapedobacter sp.]|nr:MAG: sigma-70 family RNA polymerase sigma factor [Parapedobacter sp.]